MKWLTCLHQLHYIFVFSSLVAVHRNSAVNAKNRERIAGGSSVAIENRPYQVGLLGPDYYCGGVLIKWDWIVTAAHCLDDIKAKQLIIRAGSIYLNKDGVTRRAKKIIKHPKYNAKTNNFDIGLVQLESELSEETNKFCINTIPLLQRLPYDDEWMSVSGYGDLYLKGPSSKDLQITRVKKINYDECKKRYSSKLTNVMFCAVAQGKDSCQGDSGGPIVYNGSLAGIVSWGVKCGDMNFPGVYTNIPRLRVWIVNNSITQE